MTLAQKVETRAQAAQFNVYTLNGCKAVRNELHEKAGSALNLSQRGRMYRGWSSSSKASACLHR